MVSKKPYKIYYTPSFRKGYKILCNKTDGAFSKVFDILVKSLIAGKNIKDNNMFIDQLSSKNFVRIEGMPCNKYNVIKCKNIAGRNEDIKKEKESDIDLRKAFNRVGSVAKFRVIYADYRNSLIFVDCYHKDNRIDCDKKQVCKELYHVEDKSCKDIFYCQDRNQYPSSRFLLK